MRLNQNGRTSPRECQWGRTSPSTKSVLQYQAAVLSSGWEPVWIVATYESNGSRDYLFALCRAAGHRHITAVNYHHLTTNYLQKNSHSKILLICCLQDQDGYCYTLFNINMPEEAAPACNSYCNSFWLFLVYTFCYISRYTFMYIYSVVMYLEKPKRLVIQNQEQENRDASIYSKMICISQPLKFYQGMLPLDYQVK